MASIRLPENIAKLAKASSTTVTLPASRMNIGGQQYVTTSSITLSTQTIGAGGIDATVQPNSLYYVYAIVSGGSASLIASLSSSAPSGFANFRLLGHFSTAADSTIAEVFYSGKYDVASVTNKPNLIINGNFDFWQRVGSNLAGYAVNALSFAADRFAHNYNADGTGVNNNWSQVRGSFADGQTEVPGNPTYFNRWSLVTIGSGFGPNSFINIFRQSIEDVHVTAGKTVTLSFYARSSMSGQKLNLGFTQVFGSGGSPTVIFGGTQLTLTSTFQKYTITVNVPSASGKTIGSNSYIEILGYAHQGSSHAGTFGLSAITSASSGGTVDVAQFMLNEGGIAAPFQRAGIDLQGELAKCQRYYEKSYDIDTVPGTATGVGILMRGTMGDSGGNHHFSVEYKVTKRAAASVTTYNPGVANSPGSWVCIATNSGVNGYSFNSNASINPNNNGVNGFQMYCFSFSGYAASRLYGHYIADAEL